MFTSWDEQTIFKEYFTVYNCVVFDILVSNLFGGNYNLVMITIRGIFCATRKPVPRFVRIIISIYGSERLEVIAEVS